MKTETQTVRKGKATITIPLWQYSELRTKLAALEAEVQKLREVDMERELERQELLQVAGWAYTYGFGRL